MAVQISMSQSVYTEEKYTKKNIFSWLPNIHSYFIIYLIQKTTNIRRPFTYFSSNNMYCRSAHLKK